MLYGFLYVFLFAIVVLFFFLYSLYFTSHLFVLLPDIFTSLQRVHFTEGEYRVFIALEYTRVFLKSLIICLVEPDPCIPSPCENGGTCSSDGDSYSCTCRLGWMGKNCQGEMIILKIPKPVICLAKVKQRKL